MKTSKGTIAILLAVVLSVSCGERRRLRVELTDFRKSEIDAWIMSSRRKTEQEMQEEAVRFVNERRTRK